MNDSYYLQCWNAIVEIAEQEYDGSYCELLQADAIRRGC